MFKVENDNSKIGKYIKKLIEEKYKNQRTFCKERLELEGKDKTDDSLIDREANRLSAIINGKKSIQLYDLPIFCELLNVSCEEIITAGKHYTPISGHTTNYEIAFSKNKETWDEYIKREDKIILNPDEYNKTIIDYALEFKNYDLLKYLMDKKYIWFVDDSTHDTHELLYGFCAGTSIKRTKIGFDNLLNTELKYHSEERGLRQKMIALAIESNDFCMLTNLKAREVPAIYQACVYISRQTNCNDYFNEDVIENIAVSNNRVLEYFTDDFDIKDSLGHTHRFIYPYIGALIKKLIEVKSKNVEFVLRRALQHNKSVYESLSEMVNTDFEILKSQFNYSTRAKAPVETVIFNTLLFYNFDDNDGLLSYMSPNPQKNAKRFCANVICSDVKSTDPNIDLLINDINEYYDAVRNIRPNTLHY